MGCDIHSFAEKRKDDRWVSADVEAFCERNYAFFGWLAGVRNYAAVVPVAARRGLPPGTSPSLVEDYVNLGTDAHNASWVDVSELLAVDYDQVVEDRRTTKRLASGVWDGGQTCEPGEGVKMTLREFLGPRFFGTLERLKEAGAERVVFWFDN